MTFKVEICDVIQIYLWSIPKGWQPLKKEKKKDERKNRKKKKERKYIKKKRKKKKKEIKVEENDD